MFTAERLMAVDVEAGQDLEGVILLRYALGTGLQKRLGVFVGPPVLQVAFRVILPALIVETVRQFVAHRRADRAVVGGVVRFLVEEGRLRVPAGKHISFSVGS